MSHLPAAYDPTSEALPPFTFPAQCPKCLATDQIITRRISAGMGTTPRSHEYMTRACLCGYSWQEQPADGDVKINPTICPNGHLSHWEDFHVPHPDGSCTLHGPGGQRMTAPARGPQ